MGTSRYIEPADITIVRGPGSIHLRVITPELCVRNATFRSIFPLSIPNSYISILDGEGKEVGILKTLTGLAESSRALLDEEFNRRYFTPRILKLRTLKMEAGMWHFVADSQRGEIDFFVRNWRDSAQEIAPGRWHIHSVDGARYEIPNLEKLDERSRKLMDQLL